MMDKACFDLLLLLLHQNYFLEVIGPAAGDDYVSSEKLQRMHWW